MSTVLPPLPASAATSPVVDRLLGRVRAMWRRSVLVRGMVIAVAVFTVLIAGLVLVDLLVPLPAAARELLRFVPAGAALATLLWTVGRVVRAPDVRRLALLAEESIPLENRLVTALDLRGGGALAAAFRADAEQRLAGVDVRPVAPLRVRTPAIVSAVGATLLFGFAALFPALAGEAWDRWIHPADAYEAAWQAVRSEALPGAPPPAIPAGFGELRWRVRPPSYTGLPAREMRGADLLSALPGSRVQVRSRLPDSWSAVRANIIGGGEIPVRRGEGEWSAEWTLAAGERGVSLEATADGEPVARRVIALAPMTDQLPEVDLPAPAADMVVATPSGEVAIRAVARDDYGVGDLVLTWIRSRGSGESFSFAEGQWEWDRLERAGERATTVQGEFMLDLAAAGLQPGDVLHIRAVVRDGNTVTGPGEGVSVTRVIRVALPDEMHTVTTTIGYPIEAERNPVLSQRMLILMTEELRDRTPGIEREELLHEAGEIADEQGRLRSRVGEQVYTRSAGGIQDPALEIGFQEIEGIGAHDDEGNAHTGEGEVRAPRDPQEVLEEASAATGTGDPEELAHRHDEAPIIDVNRGRIVAYNAMWEAERALRQGEPGAALPHQYEALRLLQEAKEGDRVYVRGQSRVPAVDVAGVRGSGEIDDVNPAPRSAAPATAASQPWIPELEQMATLLDDQPGSEVAADLAALAARILSDTRVDPQAASIVSRAADAAREENHDEARGLLARARALLNSHVEGGTASPLPAPADPVAAEYFRRLRGGS